MCVVSVMIIEVMYIYIYIYIYIVFQLQFIKYVCMVFECLVYALM